MAGQMSMHEAALQRQHNAEERAAHARAHQQAAERRASEEAEGSAARALHVMEATAHKRAALLQAQAARSQAWLARAHPDPSTPTGT